MAKVFATSEGFEVFPLFALSGTEVVAAAIPVLVKIRSPLFERFTNRLIMYASPLHLETPQGTAGMRLIMERAKTILRSKGLFLEVRNSERFPGNPSDPAVHGFEYIPYQNYLVDLSQGLEPLWSSYSSFTRNHIRKSEKKGATIRRVHDDELDAVIGLVERLYERKRIPIINPSIFRNAFSMLTATGNIRIMVLEAQSKVVAVRMSLNYGGTVLDWYAASDSEFNALYPNEVLTWDSIKWGAENGYQVFDFGGGAIKGQEYGPAKFKEKFGGMLVEFGRYRYYPHRWLYRIAKKVYAAGRSQAG